MKIEDVSVGSMPALRLSQYDLTLIVVPTLGGKISSICWQESEFLAHNPRKPLRPAIYAAPYADFDASGFDECFPTIGPCGYPEHPWQGIQMPDHGEIWSLPGEVSTARDSITVETAGVRLPYKFQKSISIPAPGTVQLQYRLTNLAPFAFHYLWSAHPLFEPQPGMRLCLPPGVNVLVDWSKDARLGELWAQHDWPLTCDRHGQMVDLSLIQEPGVGLVDKLYTSRLAEGWCALYNPDGGRYAAFVFSPQQVPFVGLSINQGGWPVDGPGYYNIGLEPCNGYPDQLSLAVERGQAAQIAPFQSVQWSLSLFLGATPDYDALIKNLRQGEKP